MHKLKIYLRKICIFLNLKIKMQKIMYSSKIMYPIIHPIKQKQFSKNFPFSNLKKFTLKRRHLMKQKID